MWKALTLTAALMAAPSAFAQGNLFAENIQQIEASELDALQDAIGKTAAITTISPVDETGRVLAETGGGSAFFIEKNGKNYLWTNNHVVESATFVRYELCDQTGFEHQVPMSDFWRDPNRDFASVALPSHFSRLSTFEAADLDRLTEGQSIYLIGSPLGFKCSVSKGVLSYNGRHLPRGELSSVYGDFQTDAALNPGNSGGVALVMQDGELKAIGMNTYIISPTRANVGLGFIQPLDMLQTAHDYMLSHAGNSFVSSIDAQFADLNFSYWQTLARVNDSFADFLSNGNRGAGIRSLARTGAAARAGLRVGDIIISIEDQPVKNSLMLTYAIANTLPNEEITLDVLRFGRLITVTLSPSYEEASLQIDGSNTVPTFYFGSTGIETTMPAPNVLEEYLGDAYADLSEEERDTLFNFWELDNGIVVDEIANMSPVHESGISTFTIVESVQLGNEWYHVSSQDEFERLLEGQLEVPTPVLVRYLPAPAHTNVKPRAEVVMVTPRYAPK